MKMDNSAGSLLTFVVRQAEQETGGIGFCFDLWKGCHVKKTSHKTARWQPSNALVSIANSNEPSLGSVSSLATFCTSDGVGPLAAQYLPEGMGLSLALTWVSTLLQRLPLRAASSGMLA